MGNVRKTKYHALVQPRLEQIMTWAENGVIDEKIAERLKIAYSTFKEYLKKYPELSAALKKGKEKANDTVEKALYQKATGFYAPVIKSYKVRRVEYNPETGKKIKEYEELVQAEEQEYFPPDTGAICFWLKNRQKERWSENPQKNDHDKEMLKIAKAKQKAGEF